MNKEFLKISVTNVETKYHSVNLKIWTAEDEMEDDEEEIGDEDVIISEAPTTPKKSTKETHSQHDKSPVDSISDIATQIHQECPKITKTIKKKIDDSQDSNESEEIVEKQNEKKLEEISLKLNDISLNPTLSIKKDQMIEEEEEKKIEELQHENSSKMVEEEQEEEVEDQDVEDGKLKSKLIQFFRFNTNF